MLVLWVSGMLPLPQYSLLRILLSSHSLEAYPAVAWLLELSRLFPESLARYLGWLEPLLVSLSPPHRFPPTAQKISSSLGQQMAPAYCLLALTMKKTSAVLAAAIPQYLGVILQGRSRTFGSPVVGTCEYEALLRLL